jgi:hypothetical protein
MPPVTYVAALEPDGCLKIQFQDYFSRLELKTHQRCLNSEQVAAFGRLLKSLDMDCVNRGKPNYLPDSTIGQVRWSLDDCQVQIEFPVIIQTIDPQSPELRRLPALTPHFFVAPSSVSPEVLDCIISIAEYLMMLHQ